MLHTTKDKSLLVLSNGKIPTVSNHSVYTLSQFYKTVFKGQWLVQFKKVLP